MRFLGVFREGQDFIASYLCENDLQEFDYVIGKRRVLAQSAIGKQPAPTKPAENEGRLNGGN
jgi:hypothetical protein